MNAFASPIIRETAQQRGDRLLAEDVELRARVLLAECEAVLDTADRLIRQHRLNHLVHLSAHYRRKVDFHAGEMARGGVVQFRHALSELGPNMYGPGIRSVLKDAEVGVKIKEQKL